MSLNRDVTCLLLHLPPQICSLLDVDGIRGDMVVNRAARALVARLAA